MSIVDVVASVAITTLCSVGVHVLFRLLRSINANEARSKAFDEQLRQELADSRKRIVEAETQLRPPKTQPHERN